MVNKYCSVVVGKKSRRAGNCNVTNKRDLGAQIFSFAPIFLKSKVFDQKFAFLTNNFTDTSKFRGTAAPLLLSRPRYNKR